MIDAAIQIIGALLDALLDNLPQIIAAGIQMLTALIQGIVKCLPQLIEAAIQIIVTTVEKRHGERHQKKNEMEGFCVKTV